MTSPDSLHETIIPVCAAAIIREGRVLVGRRNRYIDDSGRWELPGGKLMAGEDPRACLARELLEEFGVRAQVGDLFAVTNHRYEHRHILLIVYRTSVPAGGLSSSDHDRLIWADPRQMESLDFLEADRPIVRQLIDELEHPQP
ncbi:MAG: (deoxy)nucleoside triphosphate pyrophosphohydrolase [Deltaproteobacteria bacterium]|nr:(deoxy)nucleoside triphosphate pyrophosphohydrolase [Candidatus Zymogenaceae bacterium]